MSDSQSNRSARRGLLNARWPILPARWNNLSLPKRSPGGLGLLQSLDPRVKVVSIILFADCREPFAEPGGDRRVVLYHACVLQGSRLCRWVFFVKRVWLFMPFFTGIVAIPAFFLTPGPALVQLPWGWVITRHRCNDGVVPFVARGHVSLVGGAAYVTTPWNSVLKALGVLRVPDVFCRDPGDDFPLYLFASAHGQ